MLFWGGGEEGGDGLWEKKTIRKFTVLPGTSRPRLEHIMVGCFLTV